MTKKQTIPLIIIAVVVIIVGAILVWRYIDDSSDSSSPKDEPVDTVDRAQQLDKEADEIMNTDPTKARKNLEEAQQLYEEAGDNAKASEAERNASTAASIEAYYKEIENEANSPPPSINSGKAAGSPEDATEPES